MDELFSKLLEKFPLPSGVEYLPANTLYPFPFSHTLDISST
jgi:hypothetical protein